MTENVCHCCIYFASVQELRELKAIDVKNTMKESAASVRIGKHVDKLIEELSQELDDIEEDKTLVLDQDK